jgi:type II secretory pathway pseudopilin PulG
MSARLADEGGFTLVELMATIVVSMIVLFALFGLVDNATRRQSVATDRIEANDRGRSAMDAISSQLRSRVCIGGAQGSLVSASATEIEFFASLGLTRDAPTESQRLVLERRRLTYRPPPYSDVLEEVWVGAAPAPALPPAPPATATRKRTLLTNVSLTDKVPFFQYFAKAGAPELPAPPLSAADLTKVARIDIGFSAHGRVAAVDTPLQNEILDRSPGCYFG